MKRHEYALRVCFESAQSERLYQGESWYRANLIDRLNISRDMIEIVFCRSAKIDLDKYLLEDANPVRYQLYRAVCFYLAVTGSLPPVTSFVICYKGQEFPVDQEKLTKGWKNCRIDVLLDAAVAARCFGEDGKVAYIALTYFLKAQLDKFPHDCFRAAWSGLNALYDGLVKENVKVESKKLEALRNLMQNGRMTCAEEFVQTLGDDFWKKLQWYNYINLNGLKAIKKDVFQSDLYRDAVLYEYLTNYVCALLEKEDKKEKEDMAKETAEASKADQAEAVRNYIEQKEKRSAKKKVCINQRVCFLVCEYCYMLRNRSFHADKPYPIFGLADDNGDGMDSKITQLLLAVIKDIMAIRFGK